MINAIQHINWIAVFLGALAYFIIGALWYSPFLFGKMWAAGHKIDMTGSRKSLPRIMVLSFLLDFLVVFVTGVMMELSRAKSFDDKMEVAIMLSGAYAVSIVGQAILYQQKSFAIWVIDASYHIIGICVAAAIVATMTT